MQLVKVLPNTEGGKCSQCNADYTAFGGTKALVEYRESNGRHTYRVTEPFNFCNECFKKLKDD